MKLKVVLIQYDIIWEDIKNNLNQLSAILKNITEQVDLIIFPEMFSSGFSMNTSNISQTMDGEVIHWMKDMANVINAALLGTVCIKEDNFMYNRAVFVEPNGHVQYYNKRHLFRMGEENSFYSSGRERKIIDFKGIRIMPQICYDLRFPVWSRNRNDYDLLIYMANWPESRKNVWDVLLKARAIENQTYVIGVNRIGEDKGIKYDGNTMAVDYKGNMILNMGSEYNQFRVIEIDIDSLNLFKEKFSVYLDADYFELEDRKDIC